MDMKQMEVKVHGGKIVVTANDFPYPGIDFDFVGDNGIIQPLGFVETSEDEETTLETGSEAFNPIRLGWFYNGPSGEVEDSIEFICNIITKAEYDERYGG